MMSYSENSIGVGLDATRKSTWRLIDYSEGLNQTDILLAVTHPSTSFFTQNPNYTNLDDIQDLTHLAADIAEEENIPDLTHLVQEIVDEDSSFDLEATVAEIDPATANTFANDPFANPEARAKYFPDSEEVTSDVLANLNTDIELDVMDEETALEHKEPSYTLYFDDIQVLNDTAVIAPYVNNYLSQIQPEHRTILKDWANQILNDEQLRVDFGLYVGTPKAIQKKALYVAVLEADQDVNVVRAYKRPENSQVTSLPEYRGKRLSNMPSREDSVMVDSA